MDESCDATASGTERATVQVFIPPSGRLFFCDHHFNRHYPAMLATIPGVSFTTIHETRAARAGV